MNQKSITDLFSAVADLLDQDTAPMTSSAQKTQKEIKKETQTAAQKDKQKNTQTAAQKDKQKSTQTAAQKDKQKSTQTAAQKDKQKNTQTATQKDKQKSTQTAVQKDKQKDTQKGTQKEKSKTGFALLQPMMQNYVNNNSSSLSAGSKVEELDNDNMVDLLSGMTQGTNLTSLLSHFDMDQMSDVLAFVQETFLGASSAKQEEHANGFFSILEGMQGMDVNPKEMTNLLGGLMNLLKK